MIKKKSEEDKEDEIFGWIALTAIVIFIVVFSFRAYYEYDLDCLKDTAQSYCLTHNFDNSSGISETSRFSCIDYYGDDRTGIKSNYTYFNFLENETEICKRK